MDRVLQAGTEPEVPGLVAFRTAGSFLEAATEAVVGLRNVC
jgi:hypothetical protein